jgi:hypothetical protein
VEQFEPFRVKSVVKKVAPVMLPPGRLKLTMRPSLTGSIPIANTIGMVVVADFAAKAEAAPGLVATMTATWRRTSALLRPRRDRSRRSAPEPAMNSSRLVILKVQNWRCNKALTIS